jgi:hypothetical protein
MPHNCEWIKKMWYLYTMEFYSATKKHEISSLTSKWMELENIIISEVIRLRRPKSHSPSYMDYRPQTNAVILLHMGHTLRENTHRRNQEREENLKLECGCCAYCRGVNKVILNWQRPLWEGDQEVVKKSGRDEPMWVVIHKCMEATLRISLYSYLYLKLAKTLVYLFIYLF